MKKLSKIAFCLWVVLPSLMATTCYATYEQGQRPPPHLAISQGMTDAFRLGNQRTGCCLPGPNQKACVRETVYVVCDDRMIYLNGIGQMSAGETPVFMQPKSARATMMMSMSSRQGQEDPRIKGKFLRDCASKKGRLFIDQDWHPVTYKSNKTVVQEKTWSCFKEPGDQ